MKQYIVDAFAEKVFEGNPAAVCVMESWLDGARLLPSSGIADDKARCMDVRLCFHMGYDFEFFINCRNMYCNLIYKTV